MAVAVLGAYERGCVLEGRRDGVAGEAQDIENWEGRGRADCRLAAEVQPYLGVERSRPG